MTRTFPIFMLATVLMGGCADDVPVAARGETPPSYSAELLANASAGPHGGRLLSDGDFRLELAIFEAGVEPEFRAWVWQGEKPVPPAQLRLVVELTRLGGVVDTYEFSPREDFLLGAGVVHEPHSFRVAVTATTAGVTYRWHYDSFEGRTSIGEDAARASGIATDHAGPAQIRETLALQGTVVPDPQRVFRIHPRFAGVVRDIRVGIGDHVKAGDVLATIEANESLRAYTLTAPSAGEIVRREANAGETVGNEDILTLIDLSSVWVELAAFQHDLDLIETGQAVTIRDADGHQGAVGSVQSIAPVGSPASQSMTARVVLPNKDGRWRPGLFVSGEVAVGEHEVPLAVRREALQTFRDWTVVYQKVGEDYEVRPVTLGRMDATWAEVLDGLEPGAEYVTANSYVIKADIEKSGAKHDH